MSFLTIFVVKNKEHHLTFINYNTILPLVVKDKLQLDKNLLISLILTSHYVVENLDDVKMKIEYLKGLTNIAIKNVDAAGFKAAVQSAYPKYSGLNYLDMSAGMFSPGK